MKHGSHAAADPYGAHGAPDAISGPNPINVIRSNGGKTFFDYLRPLLIFLIVPVGFFLLEYPYNPDMFAIRFDRMVVNLWILALIFALIYLIGQQSRGSMVVFLAACLIIGFANYYLVEFRDQPLMPADLLALGTAGAVGGQYDYAISPRMVTTTIVGACFVVLIYFTPKRKIDQSAVITNLVASAIVVTLFGLWWATDSLAKTYNIWVDNWSVTNSYTTNGFPASFTQRTRTMIVEEPNGYSEDGAKALLADYDEPDLQNTDISDAPTVIAIMNESFADLSIYPYLEQGILNFEQYHRINQSSIEWGSAFSSAFGGSTCNSEFEFLTGSTMAFFDNGAFPYMQYDFANAETLTSYFNDLGYTTSAIHPELASNWSRDRVYGQMGFDAFYDQNAFVGADTLRDLVTDAETYNLILQLLEENPDPQFIFDVTIQNHGGYAQGTIPEDEQVHVELLIEKDSENKTWAEFDEYAAAVLQSEQDIFAFVNELNELDRPIVLCFFGDHQPYFTSWLYAVTYFEIVEEAGIDAAQTTHAVPYFIWGNRAYYESVGVDFDPAYALNGIPEEQWPTSDEGDAYAGEGQEQVIPEEQILESAQPADATNAGAEQSPVVGGWFDPASGVWIEGPVEGWFDPSTGQWVDGSGAWREGEWSDSLNGTITWFSGQGGIALQEAGVYQPLGPGELLTGINGVAWGNTTSLNYLGSRLAYYVGTPLTQYQQFILDGINVIPAINGLAYLDTDNQWMSIDETPLDAAAEDRLDDMRILQYYNLFDRN